MTDDRASAVTAFETTLTLPTYQARPASTVPRFDRWKGIIPRFPYGVVDDFSDEPAELDHRALILENEHLRATVLPDLGGRLYALEEKASGRDLLFRNPVIKPAYVAATGAWIAGGLEFNLPFGHNLGGFRPVHAYVDDGEGSDYASVVVGQIDRVTGMRWAVTLTLRRGSRALEQRTSLYNRTSVPQRYFLWSNAAVAVSDTSRFLFPMARAFSDEYPTQLDWPIHDGKDLTRYGAHTRPTSLFDATLASDFFGIYDEDEDAGVVHWAPPEYMPGRKLWTWGVAHDGRIWTDHLTDDGRPYVEIQSGVFRDQGEFELLEPWRRLSVDEFWYPVEGLGTVSAAGRFAAISLDPVGTRLHCRLQANTSMATVTVAATDAASGSLLAEPQVLDLVAGHTVRLAFDLARVAPTARVQVTGADGALAVECVWEAGVEGPLVAPSPPEAGTTRAQSLAGGASAGVGAGTGAPDPVIQGERLDRLGNWRGARECYEAAAASGSIRAITGSARLALLHGHSADALNGATVAVADDRFEPEARYLRGIACALEGDLVSARRLLAGAATSAPHRHAARVALATLDVARGLMPGEHAPDDSRLRSLRAGLERRLGRPRGALAIAEAALAEDPLEPLSAWERVLSARRLGDAGHASAAERDWQSRFGMSPEAVHTVVSDYVAMAWYDDAASLEHAVDTESRDSFDAWTRSLVAYARIESGDSAANTARPDGWRPRSRESGGVPAPSEGTALDPALRHRVLAWAAAYGPFLADGLRLRGELLYDAGQPGAALDAWERAAVAGSTDAVLWRNLGLARQRHGLLSAAREAYGQAITLSPDDPQIRAELLDLLVATGSAREAARCADEGLRAGLLHAGFRVAALEALLADDDVPAAIDLIRGTRFHMAEGQRWPRYLYVEAFLRAGAARHHEGRYADAAALFAEAQSYPTSFGIGESQHPENAQAAYLEALSRSASRSAGDADRLFESAASEVHASESELNYYVARSLQALGRRNEAMAGYEALLGAAIDRLKVAEGLDARGCYLRGLALLGMGRTKESRRWLREAAERERRTGEARAEMRRRIDALVPEERLPIAVWWVVEPGVPEPA